MPPARRFPHRARRRFVAALLLIAFAALWFANLDGRRLVRTDEGRYAEIAREMAQTGDWLTPRLNGYPYFEKPPLHYWATAAAYRAFGVGEGTARLWTALTGFCTVLLVGFAGRRLFGAAAGRYAALVLASALVFNFLGHTNTLDAGFTFFLTAAVLGFLLARQAQARAQQGLNQDIQVQGSQATGHTVGRAVSSRRRMPCAEPPGMTGWRSWLWGFRRVRTPLERTPAERVAGQGAAGNPSPGGAGWIWLTAAWTAAALAVLSKGLAGVALPAGGLVLYALLAREPAALRRLGWGPGLPLFLMIAVPWFVMAAAAHPEFARFFFVHEHLERYLTPGHGRVKDAGYLPGVLAAGLLPWTLLALAGWWTGLREARAAWRPGGTRLSNVGRTAAGNARREDLSATPAVAAGQAAGATSAGSGTAGFGTASLDPDGLGSGEPGIEPGARSARRQAGAGAPVDDRSGTTTVRGGVVRDEEPPRAAPASDPGRCAATRAPAGTPPPDTRQPDPYRTDTRNSNTRQPDTREPGTPAGPDAAGPNRGGGQKPPLPPAPSASALAPFRPRLFLAAYALFVFGFFALSDSKLASYVLPMFPALALLAGERAARLPARRLFWLLLPAAVLATVGLLYAPFLTRLANADYPWALYAGVRRWAVAGGVVGVAGLGYALFALWRGRKAKALLVAGFAALAVGQMALTAFDALAPVTSAYHLAERLRPALRTVPGSAAVPVYSLGLYEQSLPFYLGRTVRLADFRGELDFGIRLEPRDYLPDRRAFARAWRRETRAAAVMPPRAYADLRARGLAMRVVWRDSRRVGVVKP